MQTFAYMDYKIVQSFVLFIVWILLNAPFFKFMYEIEIHIFILLEHEKKRHYYVLVMMIGFNTCFVLCLLWRSVLH
jgi:hypothetical protein